MNASLVITFSGESFAPEDPHWLRLEVEGADDRATAADIAAVVDALYDLDPCVEQAAAPASAPTEEKLAAVAGDLIDLDQCRLRMSGDYTAAVKVIRSHPDLPYKVTLSAGAVTETVQVEEEVTVTVVVDAASSLVLPYPVIAGLRASWLGTVQGRTGTIAPPEIKALHNTLFWEGAVSGTIRAVYRTRYDLLQIAVPGLLDFPTDVLGDPQEATLLVFYHYQTYLETIFPPPVDGSADEPTLAQLCGWGGGSQWAEEEEEPLPEDPPLPADPCFDPNGDLADPEYYKQKCCHAPPWGLPNCQAWIAGHKPGKGLSQAVMDRYLAGHDGPVEFIGIGNPGPEGCGDIIHRIDVSPNNCCDEVTPLVADPDNPTEISSNGRVRMCVTGGGSVLTWQAGGGLWFDNGSSTITTTARCVYVNAPHDFCSRSAIEVTDDCSELSMILIKPDADPLEILYCDELVVAPGGYIEFTATGGTAPYEWTADGLIHMGGNLFFAPEEACGQVSITVTDGCAALATCPVKITNGVWESIPLNEDYCSGYDTTGAVITTGNIGNVKMTKEGNVLKIYTEANLAALGPPCSFCACGNDLGSLATACQFWGAGSPVEGGCSNDGSYIYSAAEHLTGVFEWVCP